MSTDMILALAVAILGSSAISSFLTSVFNRRKVAADAQAATAQAQATIAGGYELLVSRLHADNEALRTEVAGLRGQVAALQTELEVFVRDHRL